MTSHPPVDSRQYRFGFQIHAASDIPEDFPIPLPASEWIAAVHYYRTSNGAEVDLLLTLPNGEIWAIEVKRSSAPKIERGFHSACADLKPHKCFVVYSGNERFPLDKATDAISVVELAETLQRAS